MSEEYIEDAMEQDNQYSDFDSFENTDEELIDDSFPEQIAAEPFYPDYADEDAPVLTDEELDRIADTAIDYLRTILSFFDAKDATIEEYEGDEGEIILDVMDENLAVLIGRHGKTLDALQTLVSVYVTKTLDIRYPVVIDIEGYKNRRRKKIESLAYSAASRAARTRTPVRMQPMTPYERRIVHMALRDEVNVSTSSEGEDPYRRVVVSPVK